jgi:hypothetical protein
LATSDQGPPWVLRRSGREPPRHGQARRRAPSNRRWRCLRDRGRISTSSSSTPRTPAGKIADVRESVQPLRRRDHAPGGGCGDRTSFAGEVGGRTRHGAPPQPSCRHQLSPPAPSSLVSYLVDEMSAANRYRSMNSLNRGPESQLATLQLNSGLASHIAAVLFLTPTNLASVLTDIFLFNADCCATMNAACSRFLCEIYALRISGIGPQS